MKTTLAALSINPPTSIKRIAFLHFDELNTTAQKQGEFYTVEPAEGYEFGCTNFREGKAHYRVEVQQVTNGPMNYRHEIHLPPSKRLQPLYEALEAACSIVAVFEEHEGKCFSVGIEEAPAGQYRNLGMQVGETHIETGNGKQPKKIVLVCNSGTPALKVKLTESFYQ